MKKFLLLSMIAVTLTAAGGYYYESTFATCTGASNCKACKNCKYCKHCAVNGKSCGVCR